MDIPLDLERRFERRWAARFSSVPQEHREMQRQQQQAAIGKRQRKTRRVDLRPAPGGMSSSQLAVKKDYPPA